MLHSFVYVKQLFLFTLNVEQGGTSHNIFIPSLVLVVLHDFIWADQVVEQVVSSGSENHQVLHYQKNGKKHFQVHENNYHKQSRIKG